MKNQIVSRTCASNAVPVLRTTVGSAKQEKTAGSPPQPATENVPKVRSSILASTVRFDDLSDSAFVRLNVVLTLFPCSRATFWRWVKNARVPSPKKLGGGRISAWNVGELRLALTHILVSGQLSSNALPTQNIAKGGCHE